MPKNNWSKEEVILAFDLYCKTPFGSIHKTNDSIINLAKLIGRTPDAVAMKMCNLASCDPGLQMRGVKGLSNRGKLEQLIWDEFNSDWETLAFESEKIRNKLGGHDNNVYLKVEMDEFPISGERESLVRQRVGQYFFRMAVLNSYKNRCCVTGISIKSLLVASHIKPWKVSDIKTERTNPRNGLCLNALHDRAFDKGLITIDKSNRIVVSESIKNKKIDTGTRDFINVYDGREIILPNKFFPDKQFIEYHNDMVFIY